MRPTQHHPPWMIGTGPAGWRPAPGRALTAVSAIRRVELVEPGSPTVVATVH